MEVGRRAALQGLAASSTGIPDGEQAKSGEFA
jgi:hypothetical protein